MNLVSNSLAPMVKASMRCAMEFKANLPAREVEGYAATWDPDEVGDVIDPEAFNETLKVRHYDAIKRKGRSDIRVLWQHDSNQPLGVLLEARVDSIGLWIKARISKTREGDDKLQLLADGAIDRMSIGYMVAKAVTTAAGLRRLLEIILWEISFVTFPANDAAIITGVKELGLGKDAGQLELRAQTIQIKWNDQIREEKTDVNFDSKAGKKIASRNVDRIKAMAAQAEQLLACCKELLKESGEEMEGAEEEKSDRSEDAGGRGKPPSNHDVERDERAGKGDVPGFGQPVPQPDSIAGNVPSMGQPEPKPDSIAGLVPSMGQPEPKPDSIAGLVPSMGQPVPKPESIASSSNEGQGGYHTTSEHNAGEIPPVGTPTEMQDDIANLLLCMELDALANGASIVRPRSLDAYTHNSPKAPGSTPGGSGPFTVPAPAPYSIASSEEANTSSSKGLNQLAEQLTNLCARYEQK